MRENFAAHQDNTVIHTCNTCIITISLHVTTVLLCHPVIMRNNSQVVHAAYHH